MIKVKCPGYRTAGIAAGIKKNGARDLGLIYSEVPANVAGVFTNNRIQAAPVLYCKEQIRSKTCQAVIINSGNANCCTGKQGMIHAGEMAQLAAAGLGISRKLVLVASTGVIGEPLPIEKIKNAIPTLTSSLQGDNFSDVTGAIMTTDTVQKMVSVEGNISGKTYTLSAIAKGAGMIRPDMATMLCFVCSDVGMSAELLQETLNAAVTRSFNRITIDGDTSTNDTVLLLANGLSGTTIATDEQKESFQKVLDELLVRIARLLVKDGEGVTKLVDIIVKGASTDADARRVADTVSHSNLVKTALFGEDANWGRIIAAAGRANVALEPDKINIYFDGVQMVKNSTGCGKSAESGATRVLKKPEFSIIIDLNMGHGKASVITCDFSIDYVKINADYRS